MVLSASAVAFLATVILASTFIAGVFGMAGGMILMGVLVYMLPVPTAMLLHGATQLASNGWRAVLWWRYVEYRILLRFTVGALAALVLFSVLRLVPDRATVLILLGLVPFLTFAVPERHAPRIDRPFTAEFCGFAGASLQLLSGVSGPLLDSFFVRMQVDRRVVVASKAACQMVGHAVKLIYFGGIVIASREGVDASIFMMAVALAVIGTTVARPLLERLTDLQFRRWTKWIVLLIGLVYLVQGFALLVA